jgi:hypothetical protein
MSSCVGVAVDGWGKTVIVGGRVIVRVGGVVGDGVAVGIGVVQAAASRTSRKASFFIKYILAQMDEGYFQRIFILKSVAQKSACTG